MLQRDHSVDILKGIGILLVIIGHCDLFAVFRSIIYSFHMPLFIILSGYFFTYKPGTKVLTGGGKIVKAYILTAIITCAILLLSNRCDFLSCIEIILFAHGTPQHTLYLPTEQWIGPTWFLMALFWCRIFFNIIYKTVGYNSLLAFIISFFVSWVAIIIGHSYLNLPLGLLTGLSFLVYYSFGFVVNENKKIGIFSLAAIIWIFYHPSLGLVGFSYTFYPINFISASGISVALLFFTKIILDIIRKEDIKALSFLGENSLQLLCVHQITYHLGVIFGLNSIFFFLLNIIIPITYIIVIELFNDYGKSFLNRR